MRHPYRLAALCGAIAAALFALVQYGLLALQVPALIAAGSFAVDERGLWLRGWMGPALTIPAVLLAVGLLAGWLATRSAERSAQAGTRAGAAAGFGALLAVTLTLGALTAWLAADPVVQELVRLSEPHPEARLAPALIPWLGAGVGALLGLLIGAESFATALCGGLLADLLRGRATGPVGRPAP
jgi:hypothetical protein